MTTKEVYNAVKGFTNLEYLLDNSYVFPWESDIFGISKANYITEIEVKISKSDFKADFKKVKKHKILKNAFDTSNENKVFCPNRFYYACPYGLIDIDEVPHYAGLYWVTKSGYMETKKNGPLIHREKYDITKILLKKFYYKSLSQDIKIKELTQQIDYKFLNL